MFPSFTSHYLSDCVLGYTVLSCEAGPRNGTSLVSFSYLFNCCLVEFGASIFRSYSYACASLFRHIFGIVFNRTEKQMAWINTPSVIASMANQKTAWDGSVVHNPRNSMSTSIFAINHDSAISMVGYRSGPIPTSFGLVNLFPKSFHEGCVA